MNQIIYNSIGTNYNTHRAADPRIINNIIKLLNLPKEATIADIGAGTGNYSNALAELGNKMIAIEPSEKMRTQAKSKNEVAWISGVAESIPLKTKSVDGIVVILAIHHFISLRAAAQEMRRICPEGPMVLFTLDPRKGQEPWFKDYFFDIYQGDFKSFPPIEEILKTLNEEGGWSKKILPFPLPRDLADKNMYSAWNEPERYFDARFRQNTSGFALADPSFVKAGLSRLKEDLQSGTWDKKYGYLRNQKEFDAGFIFIKLETERSFNQ